MQILEELLLRYPALTSEKENVYQAFQTLQTALKKGNTVYLCGNGGSAADCEHIVGELVKSFKKHRALPEELTENLKKYGAEGEVLIQGLEGGLPAVSLCGQIAFNTAFGNDKNSALTFAQAVSSLGKKGDVLLTLSTSGNSQNCVYAAIVAKAKEMQVVFLGGGTGGKLKSLADVSVVVPEKETYKVQELHLPVYHCLCAMLESENF
ncbi:MAG: SIS domain-containing protein [Clostridia bacterium]|nr:SIS domain-containing protein [Clostridia bacterium]